MHQKSTRICPSCEQPFAPKRPKQRFCSKHCSGKQRTFPPIEERLWPQTDRTGPDLADLGPCWLFTGSLVPDGYGTIMANRKHVGTHRVAWELTYGPVPDGMYVLHHCDRRNCIAPLHLFLGTHQDNMRDMVAKGRAASGDRLGINLHPERAARGERNGSAKLTEQDVRDICQARAQGTGRRDLAAHYGVSPEYIGRIVGGRVWRHVTLS